MARRARGVSADLRGPKPRNQLRGRCSTPEAHPARSHTPTTWPPAGLASRAPAGPPFQVARAALPKRHATRGARPLQRSAGGADSALTKQRPAGCQVGACSAADHGRAGPGIRPPKQPAKRPAPRTRAALRKRKHKSSHAHPATNTPPHAPRAQQAPTVDGCREPTPARIPPTGTNNGPPETQRPRGITRAPGTLSCRHAGSGLAAST